PRWSRLLLLIPPARRNCPGHRSGYSGERCPRKAGRDSRQSRVSERQSLLRGENRFRIRKQFTARSASARRHGCCVRRHTGAPAAFVLDNGFITDFRTGAAGAVAAKHLARENIVASEVVGTGAQARYQVEMLALERSFGEVRIWGRASEKGTS